MRILVVEDDDVVLVMLKHCLKACHYAIDTASDGLKGWDYASTYEYDLLILDVMLPELDGISLCQRLRQEGYTLPILMLTSQDTSTAKTTGLDAGADDYVVKPFDAAELIARVRALLRRGRMNPLPILTWGDLWLNSSTREVSYNGALLDLTAKEYSLLEMMLRESQHVFSKEEILDSLWSAEEFPVEATVRSHMRRLRNKLMAVGAPADFIATSHGRGYYLKSHEINLTEPNPTPIVTNDEATRQEVAFQQQKIEYLELLNQTWKTHKSVCLERLQELRSTIYYLKSNCLSSEMHAESHRLAHTLVGTLGTFGLQEAMQIARNLEQELHPDIYLEVEQADGLQTLLNDLQQQVETTHTLVVLPAFGQEGDRTILETSTTEVRVMLVDDDPSFLQTVPKQLQGYGFEVSTLDDPQQFWTVLEGVRPDVLILDVQMPQINGLELCQVLRSSPSWQKLPVMFLSVLADAQTQHRAFAVGADDYLCKPITAEILSDRIQNRLQRISALSHR
jgi:DNA-binding response OmpR family regulator/HPt (histidine-containing phosphotransfer) domain-containing protein